MREKGDDERSGQDRLERLTEQMAVNRADIDALRARADAAGLRADAADESALEQVRRIDDLEARNSVDRELIAELQADGLLSKQYAAQLEEALRSSRRIGAAIGIVMAQVNLDEPAAFAMLRRESQRTNRKLRQVAVDVLRNGGLPPV